MNVVINAKCPVNRLVNIISYDLVPKMVEPITMQKFQVIVADESHFLKSNNTKRTKAVRPLILRAKRAVLLTGTPALSRPAELYTQISSLEPNLFPKFHDYGVRYCAGYAVMGIPFIVDVTRAGLGGTTVEHRISQSYTCCWRTLL